MHASHNSPTLPLLINHCPQPCMGHIQVTQQAPCGVYLSPDIQKCLIGSSTDGVDDTRGLCRYAAWAHRSRPCTLPVLLLAAAAVPIVGCGMDRQTHFFGHTQRCDPGVTTSHITPGSAPASAGPLSE
jgi:hypothetical protein